MKDIFFTSFSEALGLLFIQNNDFFLKGFFGFVLEKHHKNISSANWSQQLQLENI